MTAQVRVDGVEVTFRKRGAEPVTALSSMDLVVGAGDFVSIVGPSGCGKTTVLRVIAGLQSPSSGSVSIDGREVRGPSRATSVMFQAPTLLPWLTILDNCLLPAKIHQRRVTDAQRVAAEALLDRAGLADFKESHPHELSGGMQQRAALCRALSAKPSLLLLDEPFGALDAMTRDQMNLDLHRLWAREGLSTLLITHSINEAVLLSQRVVVMSDRPGRVVDVIDVPLPRERDSSVLADPAFTETCARIRAYFTKGETLVHH
jgi:NitT/TauT family transport system ATP-binding protein